MLEYELIHKKTVKLTETKAGMNTLHQTKKYSFCCSLKIPNDRNSNNNNNNKNYCNNKVVNFLLWGVGPIVVITSLSLVFEPNTRKFAYFRSTNGNITSRFNFEWCVLVFLGSTWIIQSQEETFQKHVFPIIKYQPTPAKARLTNKYIIVNIYWTDLKFKI